MALKEVSASKVSPYRCYVRGDVIQTEGDLVHTLGFKDGIAVLQAVPPPADRRRFPDNVLDKTIDLTKLKKIIVKVDPKTGKKYIHKDGRKIEILPQVSPILGLRPMESVIRPLPAAPEAPPSVIIRAPPLAPLLPRGPPLKYHVVTLNRREAPAADKGLQTDGEARSDASTQTEPQDGRESPFTQTFLDFILGPEFGGDGLAQRSMIDPKKLQTKEEIQKFNFFTDMRKALNFDLAGNLPIHDSVMQNNLKAVQKNCVVLRAVKENVNILNQQCYAPIHLAVLHDVNLEILKVLLDHGADVRISDPEGNTAIHLAIEHRRSAMLRVLVNGVRNTKFNLDCFNYEGFTPLILACLNKSYEDAKLLLQNGADPNVKDMKSGRTALFHAAECHDVNLVELLMQHGADTKIRNFFGTSPHDAMFELDDMPLKIKFSILGRDHQRFQNKKKLTDSKISETTRIKKAKLETTPVLKKVTTSDLLRKTKRK